MTKKTHIAVGIALTLPLLSVLPKYVFIGLIGSVTPDFDLYTLGLIKHRTLTHSLLALMTVTIIAMVFNFNIGMIFGYNYAIHLLLDSCTKTGVPLLYPFRKKYYGLKLIKTGEGADLFICLIAAYLILTIIKF